jgi:hypothetical protein
MLILAALTAVAVPSSPANSAIKGLICENALDCPIDDICSIRPGHKTGHCVGTGSPAARKITLFCESGFDCPIGDSCSIRPGQKTGRCVGSSPIGGSPFGSSPTTPGFFCELSLDCPTGKFCRIKPGQDSGRCVSH